MKSKSQPRRLAGGPRRVTDEQVKAIRAWVPFSHLAKSLGISTSYAAKLRRPGFFHKQPSP